VKGKVWLNHFNELIEMNFSDIVTLFNGTFHFGFFADVLSVVGIVFALFGGCRQKQTTNK